MLCKVTHCVGCVSDNTMSHQLHWGDWETGTAITCTALGLSHPQTKVFVRTLWPYRKIASSFDLAT